MFNRLLLLFLFVSFVTIFSYRMRCVFAVLDFEPQPFVCQMILLYLEELIEQNQIQKFHFRLSRFFLVTRTIKCAQLFVL